jgi:trigger factor
MQVTETETSTGLRREFKIVIGKTDLDTRLNTRLERLKGQVKLKGFRPGKVPFAHLKKTYGKSLMSEIIQEAVSESSQSAITERSLRPAQQPQIEFEGEIDQVVEGKSDLAFKVAVELMPEFTPQDPASIELDRYAADVDEKDIDTQIGRLAEQQRTYTPRAEGEAGQTGDALTIDFIGRIDGEPFEGGTGESVQLVIGSKRFLPGFEEQLVGAKAGDKREVNITFPDDYPAKELAGKAALFEVTVKAVAAPEEVKINDDFAAKLGLSSLEDLRNRVKEQIEADYKRASRAHLKRHLLDKLDAAHTFALPEGMVEQEFNAVWQAVTGELKREGKTFADEGKSEEELKKEYRAISERRVRLGLVLAEVGRLNNLTVSQEEMTRAVSARARQFPGQEKKVFEFYQKNPQAQAEIRAPIFEDKVVDFIFELAKVKDVKISKEDLFTDPDDLIEKKKKNG